MDDAKKLKFSMSVWWDYKGMLPFELLPRNQTINSNVYVQEIQEIQTTGQEKQIVRVLFSSIIMQSSTHLWSLGKNY